MEKNFLIWKVTQYFSHKSINLSRLSLIYLWCNNDNQWLRHYTCSGFCKTTYHLLISPPPTNLANTLKFILEKKKLTTRVECGASIHAIFQLTVRGIQMFFSLKNSQCQGKSSLKISAHWGSPFRRSQGTNNQTNSLTDRLALLQSDIFCQSDSILSLCIFLSP